MITEEHIYNTPERQEIYSQMFLPDSKLAGMMLVIHGLGEHCCRYATHFAEFFTANHYGITAFDLPGHGKSSGRRGHIEQPFSLLEIIDSFLKKNKDRFPEVRHFIYGHSFGGEIALWYTLVRKPEVSGVILSAPLIGTKDPIPLPKLFLAKTLEKIVPSFSMNNGLKAEWLSRDISVVERYRSDPLVHNQVSARTGMMIINRGKWIMEHIHENTNNILLMVGKKEAIVNPDAIKSVSTISPKILLKVWPDLYHELHNEPEKESVMRYTLKWMNNAKPLQ